MNTRMIKAELFRVACTVFAAVIILASVSRGQDTGVDAHKPDKTEAAKTLASLKSGTFTPSGADLLGQTGTTAAIPELEKQFVKQQDQIDKAKIAQVLVQLRDKDDKYWNYLVKLFIPALESDGPDPFAYDAEGKLVPGLSKAFTDWVEFNKLDMKTAVENALYLYPGTASLLGLTEDSRAIPLLRQALNSPNYAVEGDAADGLAELGDKGAIPLIIHAVSAAPASVASVIAESLVYFDNAEAQRAVDFYLPKDKALLLRQARANGRGPLR